jgi:hypothetical protein
VRRTILIAALVATAAFAPARAEVPTVVETSVDSGWSRFTRDIAARYDLRLRPESGATLTDRNGAGVAGASVVAGTALHFVPDAPLSAVYAPYTVSFSATADVPEPETSTDIYEFSIDVDIPLAPELNSPVALVKTPDQVRTASGGAVDVNVVSPIVRQLVVDGSARDRVGPPPIFDDAGTSGIERVELRFYNAFGTAETAGARVTIRQTCYVRCNTNAYFYEEPHLGIGVWTMRVFAFDLAGNQSASSRPMTFAVVA